MNEVMARGQRILTGNGENGVDILCEEVYTVGNKGQQADNKKEVMVRGQRILTGNRENGVDIPYEEVYTVGNRHHNMRYYSDGEVSGQLPWHSTGF